METIPLQEQDLGEPVRTRFPKTRVSMVRTLRDNPLLTAFIALALVVRLIFWFYTGRVWEDALITMTAARNVWEGFGLTHHASEPRVHCFTSPISVLIPLVAGPYASLLALRLSSLLASAAAIFFAYRIGVLLKFHWAGHVLVLTYLACDHLQVFFGMGGMEARVVAAWPLLWVGHNFATRIHPVLTPTCRCRPASLPLPGHLQSRGAGTGNCVALVCICHPLLWLSDT